jgi:phage I-like protein
MRIHGSSVYAEIKLGEKAQVPNSVQVLRVGKFNHPKYGYFEVTPQTLSEMKTNFDANVRGIDMSFDYFHDSDKEASGWVKGLELKENGQELWASVDWTPKATQKLSERELRYFSPDFAFKWADPEKGGVYKNVLFGGGLTNRPFVKEMAAIVADEHKGETMTELEKAQAKIKEMETQVLKLNEDKKMYEEKLAAAPPMDKVAELEKQIAALQAELAKAKSEGMAMGEEKKKLEEAAKLAEKKSAFNVLLSEGKACAAQEKAFIAGDMTEFIKLTQPVNLKGSGSTENVTLAEADFTAIIKLAEEKEKANPRLSRGESISLAKKELKK